jgi:hypothetical protein
MSRMQRTNLTLGDDPLMAMLNSKDPNIQPPAAAANNHLNSLPIAQPVNNPLSSDDINILNNERINRQAQQQQRTKIAQPVANLYSSNSGLSNEVDNDYFNGNPEETAPKSPTNKIFTFESQSVSSNPMQNNNSIVSGLSAALANNRNSTLPTLPHNTSLLNNSAVQARNTQPVTFRKPSHYPANDYSGVSVEIQHDYVDDWTHHGSIPGEKLVMKIEKVHYYSETNIVSSQQQIDEVISTNQANVNYSEKGSFKGTLVMTNYQLYLDPANEKQRSNNNAPVLALPLSTIERLEVEKAKTKRGSEWVQVVEIAAKDGRVLRFGFVDADMIKRAMDCLTLYVFPDQDEYLFAFFYKPKAQIAADIDGTAQRTALLYQFHSFWLFQLEF